MTFQPRLEHEHRLSLHRGEIKSRETSGQAMTRYRDVRVQISTIRRLRDGDFRCKSVNDSPCMLAQKIPPNSACCVNTLLTLKNPFICYSDINFYLHRTYERQREEVAVRIKPVSFTLHQSFISTLIENYSLKRTHC